LARANEARHIAEREGLPQFREWSRILVGWAIARQGRVDEGVALSTEALDALHRLGSAVARPYFLALHAEILATSRPSEAVDVLDDASEQAIESGELQHYSELLRLKSELLRNRGDTAAADQLLVQAVTVATNKVRLCSFSAHETVSAACVVRPR
jgi:predicted ATPase